LSDQRIAAISTWLVVPYPDDPLIRAVQLRGMATDPTDIGRGLGAQLLRAVRLHAASIKAEIIWANARLTALGFYERNGFEAVGPTFATADTGLAHRRVLTTVNSVTETGLD
jgi:GNAT superfamily N-acetyltransferase